MLKFKRDIILEISYKINIRERPDVVDKLAFYLLTEIFIKIKSFKARYSTIINNYLLTYYKVVHLFISNTLLYI